ncbi:transcriptional regulator [Actinoalloteichus sp. AHMU CJ021]|uniref:Transcriptional regulator n=1 Tax=Actinoalloteichus caeruleus DSM 43889 TaxID=1120930 RepID=A0ABT1JFN7_ACTCY|nr:sugar-binding domain-containing protein [Actinoalloteichus caeruleus]AUS77456.1 transcriptional regulator [Actinoalloteichus sp. AHMU CJ021]MCP2331313.1 transcriptional regulator [Actinoalloteichus caeruleus DSM 43889]
MSEPAVPSTEWGPAELVLAAAIARRFYLDGLSKVQIAAEFGLSRFKVARLLDRARATGLVRIEIGRTADIDTELSQRLRVHFGLRNVVVADTHDEDPIDLRDQVGRLAATVLTELVADNAVLGVAWGRSLQRMSRELRSLPHCTVVQLCGAIPQPGVSDNSLELTRSAAQAGGGTAVIYYAPLVVADEATAAALCGDPSVAKALSYYDQLDTAVIAVGGWGPGESTVHDVLGEDEQRRLAELGVRAELCGNLLDGEGRVVTDGLERRTIGVSVEQLRATPEVIALAYGAEKAEALRAALRGRFISTLVTHTALAERLLAA